MKHLGYIILFIVLLRSCGRNDEDHEYVIEKLRRHDKIIYEYRTTRSKVMRLIMEKYPDQEEFKHHSQKLSELTKQMKDEKLDRWIKE